MASAFLQLPPELIEAVAAATEGSDLLALRLSSNEVARTVDRVFVERYFTRRRHLVTKTSFEALLSITSTQRLCRRLETIELVVTHVTSSVGASSPTIGPVLPTSTAGNGSQTSIWSSWFHEHETQACRTDVSMLAGALSNLALFGVYPELKVCTHTHFSTPSYGFRQLSEHLGRTGQSSLSNQFLLLGRSPDDNGQTASLLLSAIAEAQFPVRRLCISDKKAPLSHASMMRIARSVPALSSALSQLECLAVSLGHIHSMTMRDVVTLAAIARSMPVLRTLSLEFSDDCDDQRSFMTPAILGAFASNSLKEINLAGATLRQQDLCAFLSGHRDSLRILMLRHVSIGPWDRFGAVFDWMQHSLSLEKLCLQWLRQGHDHMDEAIGRGSEYVFQGPEEVYSGLGELSRKATFGGRPSQIFSQVEQKPVAQAVTVS